MAIRLVQAGRRDFTVFEKAGGVGGTWRENTYPGASCDIPSMLYCFSFAQKLDWTRTFAPQPEILAYLESLVARFELGPHLRFGSEVRSLVWDENAQLWRIALADGSAHEFDVVVSGLGQLSVPRVPTFPGVGSFRGRVVHSARFGTDVEYAGRDVVVVGNAASAVQIVPRIAPVVKSLRVFQRTPSWVGPRGDRDFTRFEHWLFRTFPSTALFLRTFLRTLFDSLFPILKKDSRARRFFEWFRRWQMRSRIATPELAEKLIPDFPIGCTRFLFSDDYLEAYARANVALVTSPIDSFVPEGLTTRDGTTHPADLVVLATGFDTLDFLARLDVRGTAGRSLADVYRGGAHAFLGMAVPGFPNLFQLYGPNTNLGHNSILIMLEAQTAHVVALLERMERERASAIEVTEDAMRRFDAEIQGELATLVFTGDCQSWYKGADGRVTNNWAFDTKEYERRTRECPAEAYRLRPGA